jgi:hypothetical protein
VRVGAAGESFSSGQRLLLLATDELHADRVLADAVWAQLRARYDDARTIKLCMLVGHYEMLAVTLNSLWRPARSLLDETTSTRHPAATTYRWPRTPHVLAHPVAAGQQLQFMISAVFWSSRRVADQNLSRN